MVARALALAAVLAHAAAAQAADRALLLGTTTSVDDSGILAHLIDAFAADTGIEARAVVRGTGAVLQLGRTGDVDAVLVHDPAAEAAFVAEGAGTARRPVMTSRFLIVGPRADPAAAAGAADAPAALARIAGARRLFVSRGDDSGTNVAERALWRLAGVAPQAGPDGWYRETGSGMGATLNVANALSAYAFTESGTWASFANRGNLAILFDDDPRLANPYALVPVNPARHPHVAAEAARRLAEWLTGPAGQAAVAAFRIDGEAPFAPVRAAGER